MKMNRNMVVVWIVVIQLVNFGLVTSRSRRGPRCPPCPVGGCTVPTDCPHGVFVDAICGRSSCAKGPGESCNIRRFPQGDCGGGMYCNCGVCMGCSLYDYQCFERTCVVSF